MRLRWWMARFPRRVSKQRSRRYGFASRHFLPLPDYASHSWQLGPDIPSEEQRESRLKFIFVPALLWSVLVAVNLYRIQLTGVDRWRGKAEHQQYSEMALAGERGPIVDRLGRVLAMSAPAGSVYVRPRSVTDRAAVLAALPPLLHMDKARVAAALDSRKPFVFLQRQVSRRVAEQVAERGLPGVGYLPESKRTYPYGQAASMVLGVVGIDGGGLSGIERTYDKRLSTSEVKARVARDARGGLIQLPSLEQGAMEPQSGTEVQLTIDIDLQRILDEELERGRHASGARAGFGIMVNAASGEILAMSQAPSVNFNSLRRFSPKHLRNFAAEATFEPGSILKAVVAAGAVERGVVRPHELINCEHGRFKYAGRTVHDTHPADVISFYDVVVRSSNIGMTKVGDRLGRASLYGLLEAFGFGKATDVGVPGESGGILRRYSSWAQIDVATHSYGQGIAVTPLQVVRAFSALVNGGIVNPLRLVVGREVVDEPRRVISEATSKIIEEMLIGVVEDKKGTGGFASIAGVRVGGKTGTAQKARVGGRGYMPGKYMSSFVGFVDATDIGIHDRIVLLVTMDEPSRGSYYGGIVSAPVFQRTMKRVLEHLSLRPVLVPSNVTALGRRVVEGVG